MLKNYIQTIDNTVLNDMFNVAQLALNDMDTIKIVSAETGLSEERVEALTAIAIGLSLGQEPEMTTEADVEKKIQEIVELKKWARGHQRLS